jgi:hypothetical protein
VQISNALDGAQFGQIIRALALALLSIQAVCSERSLKSKGFYDFIEKNPVRRGTGRFSTTDYAVSVICAWLFELESTKPCGHNRGHTNNASRANARNRG